jgi:pyrroline-5-carboxylate reductase
MRRTNVTATVFLGGGRITSALIAGLRLAGYRPPIVVHDRHSEKARELAREHHVIAEPDLHKAVAAARLLIVAVRPDSVRGLLADIGQVNRPLIAVSVAAGIPLARLREQLGPPVQWARAMPSPTCRTRRGLTALAYARNMTVASRTLVAKFFAQVGPVIEIPEGKFDAFTVSYSASHGYHALATLAGAAQRLGLDRETALTAAAHALAGGVIAWKESNIPLEHLLHEAATPGGIAATVMNTMDKAGYHRMVEGALRAGMERAKANAKR